MTHKVVLCVFVIVLANVLLSVPTSHAQQANAEGVVVVRVPDFVEASPRYARTNLKNQSLAFTFAGSMNRNTEVVLQIRGAGYWDEFVECTNMDSMSVNCTMPPFFMAGEVSFKVMYNASSKFASPFLPVNYTLTVYSLVLERTVPGEISRLDPSRNISILARGLFIDPKSPNNLIVKLESADVYSVEAFVLHSAFRLSVKLRSNMPTGPYSLCVSVDAGATFECFSTMFLIYEPWFDLPRLSVAPTAGPTRGGTPLVITGVNGLHVGNGTFTVMLETTQLVRSNVTGTLQQVTQQIVADATYVTDSGLPFISLVMPATATPGFYRILFSERAGSGYTSIPVLQFEYYNFVVEKFLPSASPVNNPAKSITIFAKQFPRTGAVSVRFGQRLTTPNGQTFVQQTLVNCSAPAGIAAPMPLTPNAGLYDYAECPVPSNHLVSGTSLSVEVSVNGVTFDKPAFPELVFFAAIVNTLAPTRAPVTSLLPRRLVLIGAGFVDVPDTYVRFTLRSNGVSLTVPAQFIGEGMIGCDVPALTKLTSSPAAHEAVAVSLILGGSQPIIAPDFTYDAVLPAVQTIAIHSGNPRSDTQIGLNNTINIRLKPEGPLRSLRLEAARVGDTDLSVVYHKVSYNPTTRDWSISLPVAFTSNYTSIFGPFSFSYTIENEWGNSVRSAYMDPRVTADFRQPQVQSIKIRSSDVRNPSVAHRGDTIDIIVTTTAPLRFLTLNSIAVGSTFLNVEKTPIMAVGRYPTATFKIVQQIPSALVGVTGPVHFDLSGVGTTGNVMTLFSDVTAAAGVMDGSVVVE
eukprot:c11690_g1_i1.p1 GENE.c11690_g1_i1~~c11690_g1_i1.p1  ORF type:complete len:821 (-),score=207.26 c11690_g1_i1:57-2459(-)